MEEGRMTGGYLVETTVWWEFDKCPLPENYDCEYAAANIKIALQRIGLRGRAVFFALGDVDGLSHRVRTALRYTMHLKYADYGFSASEGIKEWARDYPDTKNYLIISNDFEIYKSTFEQLPSQSCQVLIAHTGELSAKSQFLPASTPTWQFSSLILGNYPNGYVDDDYDIELDFDSDCPVYGDDESGFDLVPFPHPHVSIPSSFRDIDASVFCGVKLSVWWDIESCPVPRDCDAAAVPLNLQTALQNIDLYDPIAIFTDTTRIHYSSSLRLGYHQRIITFVGAKYTREEMVIAMREWAINNPPPATCLLISSDVAYSSILHELSGKGYEVLVGHQCDPSRSLTTLTASASYLWEWSSLAHGDDPYDRRPTSLKRKWGEVFEAEAET